MYKTQKFRIRPLAEIKKDVELAKDVEDKMIEKAKSMGKSFNSLAYGSGVPWLMDGYVKRVFIADSNSIIMDTDELTELVRFIRTTFPELERITCYARAKTILEKSKAELIS